MNDIHRFSAQLVSILIVDDDPDCRQIMRDAIAAANVDNLVCEVTSGEDALAFLHRQPPYADASRPGLIYLDMEMPGIGGLAALRSIRRDARFADIAIVMMTGVADDHQKLQALRAGANAYSHKPIEPATFIHTVVHTTNYWLRIHRFPQSALAVEVA